MKVFDINVPIAKLTFQVVVPLTTTFESVVQMERSGAESGSLREFFDFNQFLQNWNGALSFGSGTT